MKPSFNINIALLGLCALASAAPIPQVGIEFGTPTGTLQLGDGNTIPSTLQTGDGKNSVPSTFTTGGGKPIPNTLSTEKRKSKPRPVLA